MSKFRQNRSSRFRDIAGTNFVTYGRTDVRTYVQTDGRHRKLIVDYPQATFNSTKVIWSKSVQPFPRYRGFDFRGRLPYISAYNTGFFSLFCDPYSHPVLYNGHCLKKKSLTSQVIHGDTITTSACHRQTVWGRGS